MSGARILGGIVSASLLLGGVILGATPFPVTVKGSSPITVTTQGVTYTVGCPTCGSGSGAVYASSLAYSTNGIASAGLNVHAGNAANALISEQVGGSLSNSLTIEDSDAGLTKLAQRSNTFHSTNFISLDAAEPEVVIDSNDNGSECQIQLWASDDSPPGQVNTCLISGNAGVKASGTILNPMEAAWTSSTVTVFPGGATQGQFEEATTSITTGPSSCTFTNSKCSVSDNAVANISAAMWSCACSSGTIFIFGQCGDSACPQETGQTFNGWVTVHN
jgi:hypothetical protein